MKFFSPSALAAAALLSVVVTLPFLPSAKSRPDLFVLEVRMASSVGGYVQAYYDNGTGYHEAITGRAQVTAGATPSVHRLPIPPGTYQAIRFDPLDRAGTLTVSSLRMISASGRVLANLSLDKLEPVYQIDGLKPRGDALEIVVTPGGADPQLAIALSPPIAVRPTLWDYVNGSLPFVLPVFGALALGLFVLQRAPAWRGRLANFFRGLAARPARALALVAAVSAIASTYPVVFLGRSHVSPNLGTVLLYDEYPTLPGYNSGDVADVKLSDVGAVMWQHVPFSMMQRRALLNGELPLWNRYNAAGVPLLAQGQSMFGDPLHLFVIAANGAAWAWDMKYVIAKWLFATGLGLTVLALVRDQGTKGPKDQKTSSESPLVPWSLGPLVSALLVSAAAPFIGFFLYRINHPAFFSLCYAPWPLFCLVRIAEATTRRATAAWATALVVANVALMNSGTVKEAYMLLVGVNLTGVCLLLAQRLPWRERLAKLAVVAVAGVSFTLLTAPVWLTFLETLGRAYTGYNAVSAYQIQPTLLLGLFDEIFYRPLMEDNRVFSPSLNFLLLLGVLYFLATLRLHFAQRPVMVLAACTLVPLSLAFGLISPLWIMKLPFLGNIAHLDNTFSCVLIVLGSVLAGVGFATAARRLGTREGRGDLVVAGLLLFALVFGWIAFRQASHRIIFGPTFSVHPPGQVLAVAPFIWDYLVALLVAATALAWLARGALLRNACTPARSLLLAGCLAALLWRHGLHANTIGFEQFTARPTERVDFHARSEAMQLAREAHAREPARGFGLAAHFFPGWTGVYGLETIHGPDALVNPWLRELISGSGVQRMWDWRLHADETTVAAARPFFDALNVRLYFTRNSDPAALSPALRLVKRADLDLYESPTAWPRAFFTDRVDTYEQPAELVEKIRGANGRPLAAVLRADSVAVAAFANIPRDLATRTATPATNYRFTENTTSFVVRASGPGVITLTEALWHGDFRALVNGRPARVLRLNHAFKGVAVPAAGEYHVTFRYWPRHFTRNLILGGAGLALLLAYLGWALRGARTAA